MFVCVYVCMCMHVFCSVCTFFVGVRVQFSVCMCVCVHVCECIAEW